MTSQTSDATDAGQIAEPGGRRPGSRSPDFIGIGAQRTGTSWLYACLYEHPAICMPRKEINFFSREHHWSRGFDWYEGVFAECPASAVVGEISPSYMPDPATPGRIRERYPDARLIASLRHPVDRAFSSYLNDVSAGIVAADAGFDAALRSHPEYIEAGRYAEQLARYLELFPREQLLISFFEDARRDPQGELTRVYEHIGVDSEFRPALIDRRVGAKQLPRSQRLERWLLDASTAVRRRRATRSLWWAAKRLGVGDGVRRLNSRPQQERLNPRTRDALLSEFEADNRALEALVGRELPEWSR